MFRDTCTQAYILAVIQKYRYLSLPVCICLSICLSVTVSIYLSISMSLYFAVSLSLALEISLSLYLFIYLSIYLTLSVCLPACLSIRLSLCICPYLSASLYFDLNLSLSLCLSVSLSLSLSIYLSIHFYLSLSISVYIYLSICLATYLSIYLHAAPVCMAEYCCSRERVLNGHGWWPEPTLSAMSKKLPPQARSPEMQALRDYVTAADGSRYANQVRCCRERTHASSALPHFSYCTRQAASTLRLDVTHSNLVQRWHDLIFDAGMTARALGCWSRD